MITIDQLLESVDLDFEPRFATKDKEGAVCIWEQTQTIAKCVRIWQSIYSAKSAAY